MRRRQVGKSMFLTGCDNKACLPTPSAVLDSRGTRERIHIGSRRTYSMCILSIALFEMRRQVII